MRERKPKANRHSPDRASSAEREGPAAEVRHQEVRRMEHGRRDGRLSAVQAQEMARTLEELRDEVRALGQRLDTWRDVAVARPAGPEAVSSAAPEEALTATGGAAVPPVASPETAPSNARRPPSLVAKGVGLSGHGSAKAQPLSVRLRELSVLARGRFRSAQVLAARKPFEMELALDLSGNSNHVALPVLCQVSVRARRLGDGESIVVGHASQSIASATEVASLRCNGLPLAAGLYRFEASAAVRGPDDTGANGAAFLDGGLVRVL